MCILVLQNDDCNYWYKAFLSYNELLTTLKSVFNDILFDCYEKFVNHPIESKKLIKEVFKELLVNILMHIDKEKYAREEISERFQNILTPKNFAAIINGLYNDSLSKKTNINLKWIYVFSKILGLNEDFFVLSEGICYIASKIILNDKNYNNHDLIDLFNIYFASTQVVKIHYYTNDKKEWKNFIDILKNYRPNIKLYFNE